MSARVSFDSNHVSGDFSGGTLSVGILREDAPRGLSSWDEIHFEVPPDFHSHNDSVAAALMTLVGRTCPSVSFNFPISTRCAEILRRYYELVEIGPVDPDLEPRRRGRYLGLMLSGGTDSMALWIVLKRVLGDEFKVITTEFGGRFAFEAKGYSYFQRDVSCRTDFRQKGFAEDGRFTAAVPLLFADYADLAAITTGHHYTQVPLHIDSMRDGRPPGYWNEDLVTQAGGLDEVHIMRTLEVDAQLMLAMLAEPAMFAAAWAGSSWPRSQKHYCKGVLLQWIFQQQGRPLPACLKVIRPSRSPEPFGGGHGIRISVLHTIKYLGLDVARRAFYDVDDYDLSFLDDLSMLFVRRYNTNLTQYIPAELRAGVLAVFHEAGIMPFDEHDYAELDVAREYQLALLAGAAPRRIGASATSP